MSTLGSGEHPQQEAERLGYALDAHKAIEQQGVGAERCIYAKWPVGFG